MDADLLHDMLQRLSGNNYKGDTKQQLPHGEGEMSCGNGITYKGGFYEGMFHGNGLLTFPNGCRFTSSWQLNQLVAATLHFPDELTAPTLTAVPSASAAPIPSPLASWTYCTDADRRYHTEHTYGLVLAGSGRARLVDGSMKPLPWGCYDVGDGWVGEEGGRVRGWEGRADVRECSDVELEWAKQKCRIGRDAAYTRTDMS